MDLRQGVQINKYSEEAYDQLQTRQNRLAGIDADIDNGLGVRTKEDLQKRFVGIIVWAAAFTLMAILFAFVINIVVDIIGFLIVATLITLMIVENRMVMKNFDNVMPCMNRLMELESRVSTAQDNIVANEAAYMNYKDFDDCRLTPAPPNSVEEAAIRAELSGATSNNLDKFNKAKNVFYWISVVTAVIVGIMVMSPIESLMLMTVSEFGATGEVIGKIIIFIIAMIGEIIVARLVWIRNERKVTPKTLFGILLAAACIFAASFIVMIFMGILSVVVIILVGIAAAAFGFTFMSGG